MPSSAQWMSSQASTSARSCCERLEHRANGPEEALARALLFLLVGERLAAGVGGAEQARERGDPPLGLVGLLVRRQQRPSRSVSFARGRSAAIVAFADPALARSISVRGQ